MLQELAQFDQKFGISAFPEKEPISRAPDLPDGMNEMGLYIEETPAPNPLERFHLMSCLVQLEETWKSEAAAKRPAPRYVQTSSYSRGNQPSNRRALSPALSASRPPISRGAKEDSLRKGVSSPRMPAAGKTAVSPKLGVSGKGVSANKAVSPRMGVSSKAVSPKITAGKGNLRNSPSNGSNGPSSVPNGPNVSNVPNVPNGPNGSNGPNGPNGLNGPSNGYSGPSGSTGPTHSLMGPNSYSVPNSNPPNSGVSNAPNPPSAATSKFSHLSSFGAAPPSNTLGTAGTLGAAGTLGTAGTLGAAGKPSPSLRAVESGSLKKEGATQARKAQFSPLQRGRRESGMPGAPGSPSRNGGRR